MACVIVSKCSHADLGPQKTELACVKYLRRQTFSKLSAVSSAFQHSVYYFTSDAIYFKRPIDKISFELKMSECNHFSPTCFNHLLGFFLYFYYLCACVSAKGRVFLFKITRAVALHEYFPLRLADVASPGIVSRVAWLLHRGRIH